MWIIIIGIICEFLIGGYITYWIYSQNSKNIYIAIAIALLTIAICMGTWNEFI